MKELNALVLTRDDLDIITKDKLISDINLYSFNIGSSRSLHKAKLVLFIDDNGCVKVLKNSYCININNIIE